MRITIDTTDQRIWISDADRTAEYPLYSAESFECLCRQWLTIGWNLEYWASVSWMGRQLLQLPGDVLRLAEYVWRTRPDVIIETGVYDGGSTLLFAGLCRLLEHGRVVSVERELRRGVREAIEAACAGRVALIEGDSSDERISARVATEVSGSERVCVFLDSDHSASHVSSELRNFGPLVSPGSHVIVADSICHELADTPRGDRNWLTDHPGKAVDEFLATNPEFERHQPEPLFTGAADFRGISYFGSTWLRRQGTRL